MSKPTILQRILGTASEARNDLENPTKPISEPGILAWLRGFGSTSSTGVTVNIDNALTVPAFFGAVNFMSGTLAGLPIHVYRKDKEGNRTKVSSSVSGLLGSAINEETSSFEWRESGFSQVFTGGRWVTYIERNAKGSPINLFPLEPGSFKVTRKNGRKIYETKNSAGKRVEYAAKDVIDIPFMHRPDMLNHVGPVEAGKEWLGLAIAATKYGAKIFQNGGIPPLTLQGPFKTVAGVQRASDDFVAALAKSYEEGRPAIALPIGHEAKPLGLDPEKMQLLGLQRFVVEQVARLFSLPPTFIQDMTNGSHSNTEQGDLHFVKHTLRRWIEKTEQELNLKLFGRKNRTLFVEFNVDGLLRGDFKARMEGYAKGIQNGILTPDEARSFENRSPIDGGDQAYIQGATMPLKNQKDAELGGKSVKAGGDDGTG